MTPPSTTTTQATTTTEPPELPGVPVDPASLPAPNPGWGEHRIEATAVEPVIPGDGVGAFRTNCEISHYLWDDPIVVPGQPGGSHLHAFFGNTGIDAWSDSDSINTSGNSTCEGGTANRSGYWVPAMIDTASGTVIDGDADNAVQVYYKTGYQSVPNEAITAPPYGLRIVAGEPTRTTEPPEWNHPVDYLCKHPITGVESQIGRSIPNCAPGLILVMRLIFPQCWDGVNLDSPDHQSHMAYGAWQVGCPPSHPVAIPEITYNVRFPVGPSGSGTWRLSSDVYDGPGGWSGHGDWWNGWDPAVMGQIVGGCLNMGLDCQMNLLGDGTRLH